MEGTYTDRKGREFVIKRIAGKKYKHYCKPEDANEKIPRAILLCKHPGCASACRKGGVCVKHGAKTKRCKHEGCTNQSKANHLCFRHGEKKICKHNGCTNIARGVCTRHVSSLFDFSLYKIRASLIIMIPSVHVFHTGMQTTNRVQNRGLPKSCSKRWSLL